jgi:hypothetical protein
MKLLQVGRSALRKLGQAPRRWWSHAKWPTVRWAYQLGIFRRLPFRYPFWEIMWAGRHGRPPYLWGTLCAAALARQLGVPRISVLEFGVAGGNGLRALERIAAYVESLSGVGIDVFGFEGGVGLPKPKDHRDLPQLWGEGDYRVDPAQVASSLTRAKLIVGQVRDTVPRFMAEAHAPIGFISFDLDLYHSTMDAFGVFTGASASLLPRVACYFDDIVGFSHGDFNGERLAIHDFNQANEKRKLSPIYGLRYFLGIEQSWVEMMYLLHALEHPQYAEFDGTNWVKELPPPVS